MLEVAKFNQSPESCKEEANGLFFFHSSKSGTKQHRTAAGYQNGSGNSGKKISAPEAKRLVHSLNTDNAFLAKCTNIFSIGELGRTQK